MALTAERLKFCLEWLPVGAVGVAFSALFGFQGAFELADVAAESMSEERTPRCCLSGTRGKCLRDFDENFGRPKFAEPEIDLSRGRLCAMIEVVSFDEPAKHGPILVALGFLGLDQIWEREQIALGAMRARVWRIEGFMDGVVSDGDVPRCSELGVRQGSGKNCVF